MTDPDRPDVAEVRHHLKWLIAVILVTVASFVSLTFYLYERFTANVHVME